jgi:drug/metabolite transporter (DMT)-like permease
MNPTRRERLADAGRYDPSDRVRAAATEVATRSRAPPPAATVPPLNTTDNRRRTLVAELALLFVAVVWGVNPPVIKLGLQFLPPQPYNLARLVVASAVAIVALWLSRSHRRPSRADLWKLVRVSAFGFFVFQLLFTEGIQRTTSGNASFILCLMPVSVLLLNKAFGVEAITRAVVVGIACSVTGVALIVFGSAGGLGISGTHLAGTLLLLASQAGYAYYTVFTRELLERYSTYQVTAYLMVITTVLLLAATLPDTLSVRWTEVPAVAWVSVFFSGALALCVCNFLWIWGTGVIGTARVAIFNNVSPVFAVATAYFLLGETFGLLQAAGAACVLLGVTITRNRTRFSPK